MGRFALLVTGLLVNGVALPAAQSSIPKSVTAEKAQSPSKRGVFIAATREALALPLNKRVATLRAQGPQGYRNLVHIMNNEELAMETRWRAVTALGRIGGKDSRPEIEQALQRREWYMRNAGLIAMKNADRDSAVNWARKLASDKALVVRMAAVDTLASLNDRTSSAMLWEKLYANDNFKGKQSLFIRRRIVDALARLETGNASRFMAVLSDKDETLHSPAIYALERITQAKVGAASDPLSKKRDGWLTWWKNNGAAHVRSELQSASSPTSATIRR